MIPNSRHLIGKKQQFEPELFLDDEKQAKQESSHNTDVIQSGLSIFA